MMAVQSDDVDYYRIETVIKWQNVSYADLLERGHNGEISIGINTLYANQIAIFRAVDGVDCEISYDEIQRSGVNSPSDIRSGGRKLLVYPLDIPLLDTPRLLPTRMGYADGDRVYPATKPFYPLRFLPWPPDELPDGWYYMPPKHLQSTGPNRTERLSDLLDGTILKKPIPVRLNELIVPATEISRIKSQHKATQKAAFDDSSPKEMQQAMIAAMATIIAKKVPGKRFRRGESLDSAPNATQIAQAIIEEGVICRDPVTIAKEISIALKNWVK
jgi:hypothetical protein